MRFSVPNSRVMVHQPSGGFRGQASDIMIHAKETQDLKRRLNEIYVKHTGQDIETVEAALDRDNFMSPEMAKEWGLVDEIVTIARSAVRLTRYAHAPLRNYRARRGGVAGHGHDMAIPQEVLRAWAPRNLHPPEFRSWDATWRSS